MQFTNLRWFFPNMKRYLWGGKKKTKPKPQGSAQHWKADAVQGAQQLC